MPKRQTATISVKSISPSTDGKARIGDTVVFEQTGEGVISLVARDINQDVLWGTGLIRGDFDIIIGWSAAWKANPVPLVCHVSLLELVNGRVKTLAETQFDMLPEDVA